MAKVQGNLLSLLRGEWGLEYAGSLRELELERLHGMLSTQQEELAYML